MTARSVRVSGERLSDSRARSMGRRQHLALAALLGCAVAIVYARVAWHGFIDYDDPGYVSENPVVRKGITLDGVRWAFTAGYQANWHPLTWLSHMLDVQLFGLDPGAHHLVNVALHLANALLLFAVLRRMTRALWPSFTVAALFALHPLHVESVAWIAERKDVLSTFFWVLTMWAYVRYAEARSRRWYAAAVIAFGLGLMAKQMLVTLPFVLLLLDLWPLGRLALPAFLSRPTASSTSPPPAGRERARRPPAKRRRESAPLAVDRTAPLAMLLWEKMPLFVLSAAACVVAFVVQHGGGTVTELERLPAHIRLANALVAYVRYLGKTLWPLHLAMAYPYHQHIPPWQSVAAALFLVLVSALTLRIAARHAYVLVGWLWFLGTLVPVIGLVQIGGQALADRYTYVPLVGIFIIVAWGARTLLASWTVPPAAAAAALTAVLAACAVMTWVQLGFWSTREALWSHAVRVADDNLIAHNNLGVALAARGRMDDALQHYQRALQINPDYAEAHNNLGAALLRAGRLPEAIEHWREAVRLKPDFPRAHYNLGRGLTLAGRLPEAIEHFDQALRLKPDFAEVHYDLANALRDGSRLHEAIVHYEQALRLQPDNPEAHNNLATVLADTGQLQAAVEHFQQALRLRPDYSDARENLRTALALKEASGQRDGAAENPSAP